MGVSPCRRIPLQCITHPVVGKHFQVLEVHQEVDTFEVLVGKKDKFWLCYIIHKILDSLSSFVFVNEKFCNKNSFCMISIVWKGFLRFHVAFVIKRLLYIEFSVFRNKKKKGLEMQERPKERLLHVWVATGDS